jgi:hypothetical protein
MKTKTFILSILAVTTLSIEPLYHLDTDWSPSFPPGSHTYSAVGVYKNSIFVTQRGNSTIPPVIEVSKINGTTLANWGENDIGIAHPGKTWGAHGLTIESCNYRCVPDEDFYPFMRVWVEDFTNHTLTAFTHNGKKIVQVGTPGIAGNSTSPPQFDHIADAYVVSGGVTAVLSELPSDIYVSDGDGGYANRVMKIIVPPVENNNIKPYVDWATGHVFDNPHSITMHKKSQLLIVADREQQAIKLIVSKTGQVLEGNYNCGLHFGINGGVPFGVRTYNDDDDDLLFIASMDNPQDHMHQKITVIDISNLNYEDGTSSKYSIIQTIQINPKQYSGPHLMGIDPSNGDIYAALVADQPLSTVLRFTRTSFNGN